MAETKLSLLEGLFNPEVNSFSPRVPETEYTVSYDEDGNEIVTFEPVDLKKVQKENGSVKMWSLSNMLAAGISPEGVKIHTGYNSRLDGLGALGNVAADVEDFIANNKEEKND